MGCELCERPPPRINGAVRPHGTIEAKCRLWRVPVTVTIIRGTSVPFLIDVPLSSPSLELVGVFDPEIFLGPYLPIPATIQIVRFRVVAELTWRASSGSQYYGGGPFRFWPPAKLVRAQGAYVTSEENIQFQSFASRTGYYIRAVPPNGLDNSGGMLPVPFEILGSVTGTAGEQALVAGTSYDNQEPWLSLDGYCTSMSLYAPPGTTGSAFMNVDQLAFFSPHSDLIVVIGGN